MANSHVPINAHELLERLDDDDLGLVPEVSFVR